MKPVALALLLALPAVHAEQPMAEGLRYRMQLWLQGSEDPVVCTFVLRSTPALVTQNHVQRPRFGEWRLEAQRDSGTPNLEAMMLARAQRLLYLDAPSPQTKQESFSIRFGNRSCPVWRVMVPKDLDAAAVLVEVAPRLLALCDLSAKFKDGDVARIELHLVTIGGTGSLYPAAEGTALLSTLNRWSQETQASPGI